MNANASCGRTRIDFFAQTGAYMRAGQEHDLLYRHFERFERKYSPDLSIAMPNPAHTVHA
jgi:hypothetical protein